jgi:putative transposase
MSRAKRYTPGGYCYHVLSRGNGRQEVFHKPADYEAFLRLFAAAQEIVPMRILAYALLPNHFHLVLWPRGNGDLSRWMQWLLTTHVRRYHEHYHTTGHVWQGRFKSFPIEQNDHLLSVLRYVERNPYRAGLSKEVADWPHCSLRLSAPSNAANVPIWFDPGPVQRGPGWAEYVTAPQSDAELSSLRKCIQRGLPFGTEVWQRQAIAALGLESTLRPRGRPRKAKNEA